MRPRATITALVAALALTACQSSTMTDAGRDAGDAGPDAGPDACVDGGIGLYCQNLAACVCCHGTPEAVCCTGTGLECGWAGLAICPGSDNQLGCVPLGCADLNWDSHNCGSCGDVCDPAQVCGAGTCTFPDASLSCANLSISGDNALSGPLSFRPVFASTFSNLLSDGGADPSSLNIVLSEQDLSAFCSVPVDGGYRTPPGPYEVAFIALETDGGAIGPDCFSSTASGPGPSVNLFSVLPDASVVLTWRSAKGLDAGAIAILNTNGAASGVFRALLTDGGGGMSPLSGSFNAQACQGLAYVH